MHPTHGPPPPVRPTIAAGRLRVGGGAATVAVALDTWVGVTIENAVLDGATVQPPLPLISDSGPAHVLAPIAPRPRASSSRSVGPAPAVGVVLPTAADRSLC